MAFDHERERRSSSGSTLITPFDSPTFEHDVSFNIREDVGAASISPSGRDVVLASKDGLYIIDLDKPYQPPHHVPNRSQWEVADVQWSPFASRDSWIVSTSNQKALVWNLQLPGPNAPIQNVLHAHDRAITDINFSAHHPDLLATCGVDSFVYCWDLRQPRSSALGFRGNSSTVAVFADWHAGATQVKWNRQDPNIIASSHGKYLHIWDRRKGAIALRTIDAHATKVYGIDWNRSSPTEILTCGLDKTIKLWDYSKGGPPERVIRTSFPVWRARHTPFGRGILAMPQRGNSELHLYDLAPKEGGPIDSHAPPVHSFEGHSDNVKEFLWRSRGGIDEDDRLDFREFQLVSWGRDQNLQLHKMEASVLKKVGFEKGTKSYDNIRLTRKDAIYRTFATDVIRKPTQAQNSGTEQHKSHLTALLAQSGLKGPSAQRNNTEIGSAAAAPPAAAQPFATTAWSLSRGPSGMHMKSNVKKAANVITWMQGVKMGKRDAASMTKQRDAATKLLSPQSQRSHIWHHDVPEDLGAELTYVGNKFTKAFEQVDVNKREVEIGVTGPWGLDEKAAFVRLLVRFPHGYPREATPIFTLMKTTSEITDLTVAKLTTEIQSIAEIYHSHKKGCIEAIVSYLLGERGLEASVSWLSEDNDLKDHIPDALDESSSEDENDMIGADLRTDGMDQSGGDLNARKDPNAGMPTKVQCGARWSTDGRLVFFHLPKPEPKSLFPPNLLRGGDKHSKTPRLLDAFGRLTASSPRLEKRGSSTEEDSRDEQDDGWETASSSSTGDSSDHVAALPGQFAAPSAWRGSGMRFNTTSLPSSADFGARAPPTKTNSIISSYDLSRMLPSKLALARGYEVYGGGPTVCEHNAKVAEENGDQDLSDVWRLLSMILTNNVPLEIMPQSYRPKPPILVVARRAMVRIKKKDSGLDLAFDEADSVLRAKFKSRVKWGHHPLASTWLIPALFDHFERLADTQMLAMLSCVLSEPAAEDGVTNAMLHTEKSKLPMAMQAPAFALDYFPSADIAWSLYKSANPTNSAPLPEIRTREPSVVLSDQRALNTYGSMESSNGPWGSSEPVTPGGAYSTGNTPPALTPPALSRASTFRSTATTPYSTSPEQTMPRRSGTASFLQMLGGRAFPGTSPPAHLRLRHSEADLSTSAPTAVTWGENTFYSNTSSGAGNGNRSFHRHKKHPSQAGWPADGQLGEVYESDEDDDSALSDDGNSTPAPNSATTDSAIRVTLKNQDQFDDEGCVSHSLLDKIQPWQLVQYRRQYADQLLLWGLAIHRSEILKYNGLVSYWEPRENLVDTDGTLDITFTKQQYSSSTGSGLRHDGIATSTANSRPSAAYLSAANALSSKQKPFRLNPEAHIFTPNSLHPSSPPTLHPLSPSLAALASLSHDSSLSISLTPPALAEELSHEKESLASRSRSPRSRKLQAQHVQSSPEPEGHHSVIPFCSVCLLKIGEIKVKIGLGVQGPNKHDVKRMYDVDEGKKMWAFCPQCLHVAHTECVMMLRDDGGLGEGVCGMGCGCLCG